MRINQYKLELLQSLPTLSSSSCVLFPCTHTSAMCNSTLKKFRELSYNKTSQYCENMQKHKVMSNRTKKSLILSTAMSINLVSLLLLLL